MTGDNLHPSTAGDLQSRSFCYLQRSESDYSASASAAAAADTAAAAAGDGSTGRNADYTSCAAASPRRDTASPSTVAGTAASPPIAGAASAAVVAAAAADSNPRRSYRLCKESPPLSSSNPGRSLGNLVEETRYDRERGGESEEREKEEGLRSRLARE